METNKIDTNLYKLYKLIITIIFTIIAFLKIKSAYECFRFGSFAPLYAFLTLSIIGSVYFIAKQFSNRIANIITIILYTLSSIILFLDCAYFSYMNKFTSIANLKLLSSLDSIKESIASVNPLKYSFMFWDIPIILFYAIFINKRIHIFLTKKVHIDLNIKKFKMFKLIINFIIIISFVIYGNKIGFKLKYIRTENIIYHIRDFINVNFNFEKDVNFEEYFKSPEIKKDENYGIANKRNVIIIQVEALQNFVIDRKYNEKEITPFLNSLIKNDTFYFNNYYYQVGGGNTSDAEFTVNNSLLSTVTDAAYIKYENNNYYGLPYILKENGYTNANAYHAYNKEFWNRENAYINQGFDNYYSSGDYIKDEIIGMGLSDESFLKQVANNIKELEEPFYSFIITLTSHHPFVMPEDYLKIELNEEHKDTLYGNYINSINYVDTALETFFNELKENGLYENSIFVIYGDHFGIANYNHPDAEFVSKMIGYEYSYKDMMNVPLIVHIPGIDKEEKIETIGAHVDVLPTLLHLLGIDNNKAIKMGNDLLTVNKNIVYEMMHVGSGSFITEDVFYYSSVSGIDVFNIAYDLRTGEKIEITTEMIKTYDKAVEHIENAKLLLDKNKIIKDEKEEVK